MSFRSRELNDRAPAKLVPDDICICSEYILCREGDRDDQKARSKLSSPCCGSNAFHLPIHLFNQSHNPDSFDEVRSEQKHLFNLNRPFESASSRRTCSTSRQFKCIETYTIPLRMCLCEAGLESKAPEVLWRSRSERQNCAKSGPIASSTRRT